MAVRLHAAARHAWGDCGRASESPNGKTHFNDSDTELFTQCRNRTVTNLKCGTTQCKNPVNCVKAIQVKQLSPVIPTVAASVTAVVCSGMLRFAPRLAGTLLIPLALAGSAPALGAQRLSDSTTSGTITHPHPRALIIGIVGAIAGGLAGYGFGKSAGRGGGGGMTFVGIAGGGLAGFFIGRQLDERRAIAYRGTPSLKIPNVGITLEGDPNVLTVRDGTAAVGGSAGVELFSAMDARLLSLGTRATGLHGISAIDIAPRTSWLALGSRTGLYIYPPNKG